MADSKHEFPFLPIVLNHIEHEVDEKGWYHVGHISCDLCDRPASYFHPAGGMRCNKCVRP